MADAISLLLLAQQSVQDTQYVPAGGQLVNSTSQVAVFSWPVAAGVPYQFRASVFYKAGAVSAGQPQIELTAANGAVASFAGYNFTYQGGGSTPQSIAETALSTVMSGPVMTANDTYVMGVEGTVEFSTGASGGFVLSAGCSVAADTWTITQGAYMLLNLSGAI